MVKLQVLIVFSKIILFNITDIFKLDHDPDDDITEICMLKRQTKDILSDAMALANIGPRRTCADF